MRNFIEFCNKQGKCKTCELYKYTIDGDECKKLFEELANNNGKIVEIIDISKEFKNKEQIKTLKEFCDEQNGCENCKLGDYSFSDEDCKKLYSIACKNKGKITITIDISKEI